MERTVKINLLGKSFDVRFPNNGELIQIETRKVALSDGLYSDLITANSQSANIALDMIDSFATFIVLIPELDEMLEKKSLLEMNVVEAQDFVVGYSKAFIPFFKGWVELMKEKAEELNKLYETEKDV